MEILLLLIILSWIISKSAINYFQNTLCQFLPVIRPSKVTKLYFSLNSRRFFLKKFHFKSTRSISFGISRVHSSHLRFVPLHRRLSGWEMFVTCWAQGNFGWSALSSQQFDLALPILFEVRRIHIFKADINRIMAWILRFWSC